MQITSQREKALKIIVNLFRFYSDIKKVETKSIHSAEQTDGIKFRLTNKKNRHDIYQTSAWYQEGYELLSRTSSFKKDRVFISENTLRHTINFYDFYDLRKFLTLNERQF